MQNQTHPATGPPPPAALGLGVLAALGFTLASARQLASDQVGSAVVLVIAAFVMGVRPVRVPRLTVAVAPIHFFALVALIELGPLPALAAAFAGVTGAAVAPEKPFRGIQICFNLAAIGLSILAAYGAILAMGHFLPTLESSIPAQAIASTVAFALVNSFLVAMAIALEQRRSFPGMWLSAILCESWCHPLGCLATIVVLLVLDAFSMIVFAMVVSAIWLGVAAFRGRRGGRGQTARP